MAGPLTEHVSTYVAFLVERGFAAVSIRHRLSQFRQLSRWLGARGADLDMVTCGLLERFAAERAADGRVTWLSKESVSLPFEYLRSVGAVAAEAEVRVADERELLLEDYRRYLLHERGLTAGTTRAYHRIGGRFLAARVGDGRVDRLTAGDAGAFVLAESERGSDALAKKTGDPAVVQLRPAFHDRPT